MVQTGLPALRRSLSDVRGRPRRPASGVRLQSDTCSPGAASCAILETSPFPIFLVSLVGIVLLTVFGPSLVVGDTWLTLMAGREIVDHGLPDVEHITLLGEGSTWTDQQWLAQLVFYGAHELAGMRLVVVLDVALVLLALGLAAGAARSAGASSRSTFLIGLLAILAGPWGWTIRAQSAALPLFAGLLWLLLDGYRNGVRRRTLLVAPAARALGEPPWLGRPRRGAHDAPRARDARPRPRRRAALPRSRSSCAPRSASSRRRTAGTSSRTTT